MQVEDATHRLACVDLDWDHVRAVDILAVLRSFLPKVLAASSHFFVGCPGHGTRFKLLGISWLRRGDIDRWRVNVADVGPCLLGF